MARRKIFTGTFGPGPHRTHARPRGHTICDHGPRHAAECGLTTPGQLCKSQPGHVAFLLSGKLVIKQLNGALRRRALFTPLPLHVRCKGLSETKARAQQGQEAWQVLKFVRRESLDPQNQSSQPFLRLRCTPSRCGTVGQTLQGFRGLGSGPQGLLSFRRFELFSGFPDLCKSPPRQPLSLNGKVANVCERRSWSNKALGSYTVRPSTCKLRSPTTLTEALILGRSLRFVGSLKRPGQAVAPLNVDDCPALEAALF